MLTKEDAKVLYQFSKSCRCYICGDLPGKKTHGIDHDHTTNRIRGFLCVCCNQGLGMFKDSTAILQKAISYLEDNR